MPAPKGHKQSEETCRRKSQAHTGKTKPQEVCDKISQTMKGYKWTDERMANFMRARWGK